MADQVVYFTAAWLDANKTMVGKSFMNTKYLRTVACNQRIAESFSAHV